MFKPVSPKQNFPKLEEAVLKFWRKDNTMQKSIRNRKGKKNFTFYEGPPFANGKPHIGHVLTRVFKDIIIRYKTMQSFYVERKAGWDTHGLPVEMEVEKQLKLETKKEIEKYGIGKFTKECRQSVFYYKDLWEKVTERIGYWLDLKNAYATYTNDYVESVWWVIKQIWDKKLIYQDYKVLPYCPRCGTTLSSHEVAQGYKAIKEESVYLKFKLKDRKDTYFLVWTTTPWTLPGNVALAINPDIIYTVVKVNNERYILAQDRLGVLDEFLNEDYKVVEKEVKGKDLLNLSYKPPFDFIHPDKRAHYTIPADFVRVEDGTGIVHIAPAFGEEDFLASKEHNLPIIFPVDEEGKFVKEVLPYAGLFVKDADPKIVSDLKKQNLFLNTEMIEHTYPFCWRCDTLLLYYAKSSWFIQMSKVRKDLLKNNRQVNWYPKHLKEGRFGDWLESAVDWAISRERFWGTPLPIWECEKCEHQVCVGSIKELEKLSREKLKELDLHRPDVDHVDIDCPKCEGKMKRVPEVIDCWVDSGSMPYAQWHYPFENKEKFKKNFPADYICEAIDQTRGWFYTLLALSTLLFDKPAYLNVISLGHVLDEKGQKMSKSKGNVVEPQEVIEKHGTDALRWYLYTASSPGNPRRFSANLVEEAVRKFMLTLWNTYTFFVTYAKIDKFKQTDRPWRGKPKNKLDRWILSYLNELIKKVTNDLDNYDITNAGREIQKFTEDLSNWYVRRSRRRFWKSENDQDKKQAYHTLHTVLLELTKLIAPFTPFVTEEIYQNLTGKKKSIHLANYPKANTKLINKKLNQEMEQVLRIVNLARAVRNKTNLKTRQPLSELVIFTKKKVKLGKETETMIKEELNVKNLRFTKNLNPFAKEKIELDFKIVGPRLGRDLKKVQKALADGNYNLSAGLLEVTRFKLESDEFKVAFAPKKPYKLEHGDNMVVFLDTRVTKELKQEGLARDLVRLIQDLRKEADYNIDDRITLYLKIKSKKILGVIEKFSDYIKKETLAKKIELKVPKTKLDLQKVKKLGKEKITIGLKR